MQNKTDQLKILNARMAIECPCTLRETATQAVPGDGSAFAEIMFVGEAPGKNEDIQGDTLCRCCRKVSR